MNFLEMSKPASIVADELTARQKIALAVAGNNTDGCASVHSSQLVFSQVGQIGYGVLRALKDKGLIYLYTGGPHGGSHTAYYELTGKGRAVLNFMNEAGYE